MWSGSRRVLETAATIVLSAMMLLVKPAKLIRILGF